MKLPCTNKYISLNILNYFMFLTNIGFLVYIYLSNKKEPIVPYEIIFLMFNYYRFAVPIVVLILLIYIFYERKEYKKTNSKTQNILTSLSYLFLFFILLSFVLTILFVAIIAHGLDM